MGAINRLPQGLLSYLDTQTQGVNPAFLAEQVAPTVDLEPFYRGLVRYGIENAVAGPVVGPGTSAGIFVPNDQLWLIYSATAEITHTAGAFATGLRGTLILSTPNALQYTALCSIGAGGGLGAQLAVGDAVVGGAVFDRPVVVPPGWSCSILVNAFAGGATLQTRTQLLVSKTTI